MLDRLFGESWRVAARARLKAIAEADWIAVAGDTQLAMALASDGHRVITIEHRRRRLRGAPNPVLAGGDGLPVRGVAALVASHPGGPATIEAMTLAVASGGLMLLWGGDLRSAATQALAGGLTDIEQAGKLVTGRVVHFGPPT